MNFQRLLWDVAIVVLLVNIKTIWAKEAGEILSNIDIEGGKEYKYIYSSLLNKPPVEDVVDLNNQGSDGSNVLQDDVGVKRQIYDDAVNYLWPQGIIPYTVLDSTYTNVAKVHRVLNTALNIWMEKTCIEFWDKSQYTDTYLHQQLGHMYYVIIKDDVNCLTDMGLNPRNTQGQRLNLNENGCIYVGTILHELGHLLGLVHEHQREDRNLSETVNYNNIKNKYKHNFAVLNTIDDTAFDYSSIMHYGLNIFSKNNKPTLSLKDSNLNFLAGQREHLSFYDVKAVNLAYECNGCSSGVFTIPRNGALKLRSPSYPFSYGNNKCAWLLKSSIDQTLSITIKMEDIPRNKHTHKCYHSIEIRYNVIGQPGVRFCGDTSFPFNFESLGSFALIIFHGDDTAYSGKNFEIRVASGNARKACSSNPCTGFGQKCVGTSNNGYMCECMDNFSGPDCSLVETIDCSFDRIVGPLPLCLFSQSTGDDLDWIRQEMPTSSTNTGPDHALNGEGSYLYMESSFPAKSGFKATLDSALIAKGQKCLSFYYHMYGNTMGQLLVFILNEDGELWSEHWLKHGNQGNEWHHVFLELFSHTNFKIRITAVRGRSHRSDIAIDSVSVFDGLCDNLGETGVEVHGFAGEMSCPMNYVGDNCDMICAIYQLEKLFYGKPVDCGRLLCTLHPTEIRSQKVLNQQSYDIWRTQRLTKIDCPRGEHYEKNRKCIIPEIWKKETGRTPTAFTGPNADVSGNGYYIYVDGSFVTPGMTGSIDSEYIQAGKVCVDIQVHIYGQGVGALSIKFEDVSGRQYFLKSDIQSENRWVNVFFDVYSEDNFRIIMTAYRGETSTSDIALDDFNVARGKCYATFTYPVTLT